MTQGHSNTKLEIFVDCKPEGNGAVGVTFKNAIIEGRHRSQEVGMTILLLTLHRTIKQILAENNNHKKTLETAKKINDFLNYLFIDSAIMSVNNQKEKYKNNGTEEILCPKCKKGFPHGAAAVKSGQEFYHENCIKNNPK